MNNFFLTFIVYLRVGNDAVGRGGHGLRYGLAVEIGARLVVHVVSGLLVDVEVRPNLVQRVLFLLLGGGRGDFTFHDTR